MRPAGRKTLRPKQEIWDLEVRKPREVSGNNEKGPLKMFLFSHISEVEKQISSDFFIIIIMTCLSRLPYCAFLHINTEGVCFLVLGPPLSFSFAPTPLVLDISDKSASLIRDKLSENIRNVCFFNI